MKNKDKRGKNHVNPILAWALYLGTLIICIIIGLIVLLQ